MSALLHRDYDPRQALRALQVLDKSSKSPDARRVIKIGKQQIGKPIKGVPNDARNTVVQLRRVFETYGESGDNLFSEKKFDNPTKTITLVEDVLNDGSKLKLLSLPEIFQALLESAANTLKNDPSDANTRRVMFDVLDQTMKLIALKADMSDSNAQMAMLHLMEQSSQVAANNIIVPQFNSKDAGVRVLVFNVYSRLAKLLGRNSVEAVRADFKTMLDTAGERISYNPGLGRSSKTSPVDHIANVIEPLLDGDFKEFAYEMNSYRTPSFMKFYNLLGTWRSRNKEI